MKGCERVGQYVAGQKKVDEPDELLTKDFKILQVVERRRMHQSSSSVSSSVLSQGHSLLWPTGSAC